MSFAYCITHNEVSPWGCRHCRRAAMDRDLQIAVEATRQAMHDAFHDALKKETAHDSGISSYGLDGESSLA